MPSVCANIYLVYDHFPGIVVGAWPCDTVVWMSELFGAESKAQVYGTLHTFLQENADSTSDIRVF